MRLDSQPTISIWLWRFNKDGSQELRAVSSRSGVFMRWTMEMVGMTRTTPVHLGGQMTLIAAMLGLGMPTMVMKRKEQHRRQKQGNRTATEAQVNHMACTDQTSIQWAFHPLFTMIRCTQYIFCLHHESCSSEIDVLFSMDLWHSDLNTNTSTERPVAETTKKPNGTKLSHHNLKMYRQILPELSRDNYEVVSVWRVSVGGFSSPRASSGDPEAFLHAPTLPPRATEVVRCHESVAGQGRRGPDHWRVRARRELDKSNRVTTWWSVHVVCSVSLFAPPWGHSRDSSKGGERYT